MVIWPARLAEKYITAEERKAILTKVNDYAQTDDWFPALSTIISEKTIKNVISISQFPEEISNELNGDPEPRFDTGTLSLLLSVGLAVGLTLFITCKIYLGFSIESSSSGCVCAFRCCGNVKTRERRKSVERAMDNLRNSVIRRGSQFRRFDC